MAERRSLDGNLKSFIEDQTLLFIYPFPGDHLPGISQSAQDNTFAGNNIWVIDDLQDITRILQDPLNSDASNAKHRVNTGCGTAENHWVEQYVEVCLDILPYPDQKPVSHLYIPAMLDSKRPSFSPFLISVLLQWNQVIDDVQADWKDFSGNQAAQPKKSLLLNSFNRLKQLAARGLCYLSQITEQIKQNVITLLLRLYYRRKGSKTMKLSTFSPVWTGKQAIHFDY
jgi:hypothetical protein